MKTPPPRGAGFEHLYWVDGRVVDKEGWPASSLDVVVSVSNVKGVRVEPVRTTTNCNGDFGVWFPIGTLDGRGKVRVEVAEDDNEGVEPVSQTQDLDRFFRRNDFVLKLEEEWPFSCGQARSYWPGRITAWGRVVEGVEPHDANGTHLDARAIQYWPLDLIVITNESVFPPDSVQPTDEFGDFQYSWTFNNSVEKATVAIRVKGVKQNITIDPLTRVAYFKINVGQPPTLESLDETPGAALGLALAAVAAVALATARRRR